MTYTKIKSSVRIADLDGATKEIINFLDGQNITEYPNYVAIVDEVKTHQQALSLAISRSLKESELADLDTERDGYISAINITLQAAILSPNATESEAAKKVMTVFVKYGAKISQLNYSAESAQINSMLTDFKQKDVAKDIAAIANMSNFVSKLQTAQTAFEVAEVEYDHARTNQKGSDSASRVKPKLLEAISNMIDFHNAIVRFKDADFKNICDTIDTVISGVNRLVKARVGSRTNKEEETNNEEEK
ncbi:MAG: DUF6261 family protein [Bacteroidales bacterium]